MRKLKSLIFFASFIVAVSPTAGNGTQNRRPSTTAVGRQMRAPELADVGQLKAAFQADAGKVRLIALLSPT